MNALAILIPVATCLGLLGLCACLWAIHTRQYDDPDGSAWRSLQDDLNSSHHKHNLKD